MRHSYAHFSDEETEAEEGKILCLRPHSWKHAEGPDPNYLLFCARLPQFLLRLLGELQLCVLFPGAACRAVTPGTRSVASSHGEQRGLRSFLPIHLESQALGTTTQTYLDILYCSVFNLATGHAERRVGLGGCSLTWLLLSAGSGCGNQNKGSSPIFISIPTQFHLTVLGYPPPAFTVRVSSCLSSRALTSWV